MPENRFCPDRLICRSDAELKKHFPPLTIQAEKAEKSLFVHGDPASLAELAAGAGVCVFAKNKTVKMLLREENGSVLLFVSEGIDCVYGDYEFSPPPLIRLAAICERELWRVSAHDGGFVIDLGRTAENSEPFGEFPIRDVDDTFLLRILSKYIRRK